MLFGNSRRLSKLEEDLTGLDRRLKALELDWNDVYAKLRRIMSRISKTSAMIDAKEQAEGEGIAAPSTSPDGGTQHGPFLSSRQRFIQQQILRRRAGV